MSCLKDKVQERIDRDFYGEFPEAEEVFKQIEKEHPKLIENINIAIWDYFSLEETEALSMASEQLREAYEEDKILSTRKEGE